MHRPADCRDLRRHVIMLASLGCTARPVRDIKYLHLAKSPSARFLNAFVFRNLKATTRRVIGNSAEPGCCLLGRVSSRFKGHLCTTLDVWALPRSSTGAWTQENISEGAMPRLCEV
eukprot:TRINITY_DN38570_c0_g1_i2.p1 TRINITY_DN38570_c0_g1~~TRINITY_DN38570_c0_g1_i2.p1  ORF type:complete len:116 (-),score=7.40 TRINITY_DN38570_c0_g1_i2:48-395(-)